MGIFGASLLPAAAMQGLLADPQHPGISAVRGSPQEPMAVDYPYAVPPVPAYKSPGVARSIVGSIGDALQQWSGGQATFGPEMQRQRQYAQAVQQAQMQRAQAFADQKALYDYKAAHPGPTSLQSDYSFLNGMDPQLGQKFIQNKVDPVQGVPVTNPDGSQGLRFIRPSQMGGAQPQSLGATLPQGWTVGGAGPSQAPQTFPLYPAGR